MYDHVTNYWHLSKYYVSCLALILWIAPLSAVAMEPPGERYALVIGNSDYESINTLKNPGSDANAVAKQLRSLGFKLIDINGSISEKPIVNANRREFSKAIRNFSKVVDSSESVEIAFLYYAGHGMQDRQSSYLLPVDVPNDDVELVLEESIDLDSVLRRLDGKAALTIAVFDACREIPVLDKPIETLTRSVGRGQLSDYRGLARPRGAGRSRLIAYSGAAGQLVDDGSGDHSPYTALLLEAIAETDLSVEQMFQQTAYRFSQRHDGQNPELVIQGVPLNRFFLAKFAQTDHRNPPITEEGVPTATPNLSQANKENEKILWELAESGGTIEEYQAFIATFPNGDFSRMAKVRIQQLRETTTSAESTTPMLSRADDGDRQDTDSSENSAIESTATAATNERLQIVINRLSNQIIEDISANRLTSPVGNNAEERIRELAKMDPSNPSIDKRREAIIERYENWINYQIAQGTRLEAEKYLTGLSRVEGAVDNESKARAAIAARWDDKEDGEVPAPRKDDKVEPVKSSETPTAIDYGDECKKPNFFRRIPAKAFVTTKTRKENNKIIPYGGVSEVNLNDGKFHLYVKLTSLQIREYKYVTRLYDGSGKVVYKGQSQFKNKENTTEWTSWVNYTPGQSDSPGEWTFLFCESGFRQAEKRFSVLRR